MATASRLVFCELKSTKPATPVQVQKVMRGSDVSPVTDNVKIVLQPRLCTLRSYGSTDRVRVIKSRKDGGDDDDGGAVTSFFATLSDYIESSKKSQDFETISGRLAMMVFAATLTTEVVTGNSLFRKMDVERIAEALGVCLAAVTCAATFAYFSSARNRVDPRPLHVFGMGDVKISGRKLQTPSGILERQRSRCLKWAILHEDLAVAG